MKWKGRCVHTFGSTHLSDRSPRLFAADLGVTEVNACKRQDGSRPIGPFACLQQFRFVMPSKPLLRRYVGYGAALVPGALAASLSFSADKYLVGYYLDLKQVGIYSVCFTSSANQGAISS